MLETLNHACQAVLASRQGDPRDFAKEVLALEELLSRNTAKLDSVFGGDSWRIGINARYMHLSPHAWEIFRKLLIHSSRAAWERWDAPLDAAYGPAALALLRDGDIDAAAVLAGQALCSRPAAAVEPSLADLAPSRLRMAKIREWSRHGSGDYQRLMVHPASGELWALGKAGGMHIYGRDGVFLRDLSAIDGASDMFPDDKGRVWICQAEKRRLVRLDAQNAVDAEMALGTLVGGQSDICPLRGVVHQGLIHLQVRVGGNGTQILSVQEECPEQWASLWGDRIGALCANGDYFCCVTGAPSSLALYHRTPRVNQWHWRRWRFLPQGFQARCVKALDGKWIAGGDSGLVMLDENLMPAAFYSRLGQTSPEHALPSFDCFCVDPNAKTIVVYDKAAGSFHEYAA
jgi:hypothetical protein